MTPRSSKLPTASAHLLVAALSAGTPFALAQSPSNPPAPDWKGYAGAGLIAFPKYTGGRSTDTLLAPLLSFEYKETFYVDLVRAGVRLWSSGDRKLALGLAAEPRFGFRAGDGPRLAAMATRRDSIEAGPSVEWETPAASFNLAWFGDIAGASRGSSLRVSAWRPLLDTPRWDVGAYVGLERVSGKVANYYFGVAAAEAIASRPLYQPGASTHWNLGLSGAWKFSKAHSLMFGLQNTRLGAAAADSPIVETRNAAIGYVGLGWNL